MCRIKLTFGIALALLNTNHTDVVYTHCMRAVIQAASPLVKLVCWRSVPAPINQSAILCADKLLFSTPCIDSKTIVNYKRRVLEVMQAVAEQALQKDGVDIKVRLFHNEDDRDAYSDAPRFVDSDQVWPYSLPFKKTKAKDAKDDSFTRPVLRRLRRFSEKKEEEEDDEDSIPLLSLPCDPVDSSDSSDSSDDEEPDPSCKTRGGFFKYDENGEKLYFVDDVLGYKIEKNTQYLRIKYKGYKKVEWGKLSDLSEAAQQNYKQKIQSLKKKYLDSLL